MSVQMQEHLREHLQAPAYAAAGGRVRQTSSEEAAMTERTATGTGRTSDLPWRKSTFSNPSGNCVEVAHMANGLVAVRNSRDPEGAVLVYTRPEIDAFLRGAKSGEFDDLAG
jgi:hypothetical protein